MSEERKGAIMLLDIVQFKIYDILLREQEEEKKETLNDLKNLNDELIEIYDIKWEETFLANIKIHLTSRLTASRA